MNKNENYLEIGITPGKRLFRLRKKLDLTRKKFNKITGISEHTLRHLEKEILEVSHDRATLFSLIFTLKFKMEEVTPEFILYGLGDISKKG